MRGGEVREGRGKGKGRKGERLGEGCRKKGRQDDIGSAREKRGDRDSMNQNRNDVSRWGSTPGVGVQEGGEEVSGTSLARVVMARDQARWWLKYGT